MDDGEYATSSSSSSSSRPRIQQTSHSFDVSESARFSESSSSATTTFSEPPESASLSYQRQRAQGDAETLTAYLRDLFPPLEFPDTVAKQMLTHISAGEAWAGHNARLSFLGTPFPEIHRIARKD